MREQRRRMTDQQSELQMSLHTPGGLVGMAHRGGRGMRQGYMFKRETSSFKSWSWRFFELQNGRLTAVNRDKPEQPAEVVVDDLRICTTRKFSSELVYFLHEF